ncbi:MAG: TolC family protein [Planctomycetes bacterium]|nr:TolC family protein [Planctomycetota bacterium]
MAIAPTICGVLAAVCANLTTGCTASWYAADADREVHTLLADYEDRVLGDRQDWVRYPDPQVEAPPTDGGGADVDSVTSRSVGDGKSVIGTSQDSDDRDSPTKVGIEGSETEPGAVSAAAAEPMLLDLPTALSIAFTSSRRFKDREEALYLRGLGFTLTRYNFGPILNSTVSYLWTNVEDGINDDSAGLTFGASQVLHTGGDLSVSSALNTSRADDPNLFDVHQSVLFNSSIQVNLRQPLLRGAGYEASHESLTQGERDLIYEIRAFELFRQDFSIEVAGDYYRLVSQQRRLANDERNYLDATFDREKAEALRQVDRNQDDDVFLAQRREIDAEDALLVARTDYQLALDNFKILLGLPTAAAIDIVADEPEFLPVRVDPDSTVQVAYHNRLDLHTARDRLEDTERRVRLAKNALLPDWDVTIDYRFDSDTDRALRKATPEHWTTTLGVDFEIPVNRKAERNAYRSAQIGLERARRDYARLLDEVRRDILDQVRELAQLEKRIRLQTDKMAQDEKAVAVTQIRYEAGDADNRDLLDARQGLIDAQNSLIALKVQHFTARLRLLRNTGVMFVNVNGMWQE